MSRLALIPILFLFACNGADAPKATSYEKNGPLKHIVLLDLKDSCSEEDRLKVIERLKRLSDIEGVMGLEVSARFESNDSRAKEDYDLMLYMEFASEETLYAYATDESHLAVREEIKPYMAGVPEVLDASEK